jgi:hypothetical protein
MLDIADAAGNDSEATSTCLVINIRFEAHSVRWLARHAGHWCRAMS